MASRAFTSRFKTFSVVLARVGVAQRLVGLRPAFQINARLREIGGDVNGAVAFGFDDYLRRDAAAQKRKLPAFEQRRHFEPLIIAVRKRLRTFDQRRHFKRAAIDGEIRGFDVNRRGVGHRHGVFHRQFAEVFDAMKSQEIGVVIVVRAAFGIVVSGAARGDDVVAVEDCQSTY